MVEIKIDSDICQKDGLCAMTCTFGIFQQEEAGTIPKIDDVMLEKCYRCGHCVSICPQPSIETFIQGQPCRKGRARKGTGSGPIRAQLA